MATSPYSQEFPLGSPSVSGNQYTVDLMLREPTRINNYLSDLTLKGYFAERIFPNAGGVSGGAVLFTQLLANDILPTRRAQEVKPGAEFPEVTFDRPEPRTKQVFKLGGKFRVTDEAKDRNDLTQIQSETMKLSNDLRDQLHTRALAELEASISEIGSAIQLTGKSWLDAQSLTLSTENKLAMPTADFAALRRKASDLQLGSTYNLWILNPQEQESLEIIYGDRLDAVLRANDIDTVVTPLQTPGTAYVVSEGTVGEVRYEQELRTVVYRDDATESQWVQSSVRPVYVVTRPYDCVKVTGLAA